MLGLKTFFTAGPNEIRAWTIKNGFTAPNAAGVIHSDFERGFIKAEVIDFDDYIENGGELGSKENGKLRLEGKEYLVKDGDVIHFKFNVWVDKNYWLLNFKDYHSTIGYVAQMVRAQHS